MTNKIKSTPKKLFTYGAKMVSVPEFPSIKSVPEKMLTSIWKTISNKPLPEVYAYTLDSKDFDNLLDIVQKNPGVVDSRVREYGVDFDDSFIEAFSFKVEDCFVVFVKQSAPLRSCLVHELKHILNDDYST